MHSLQFAKASHPFHSHRKITFSYVLFSKTQPLTSLQNHAGLRHHIHHERALAPDECVPGSVEYEGQSCLGEVHVTCKAGDVKVSVNETLGAYEDKDGTVELKTKDVNGKRHYICTEGSTIYVDFRAEVENTAHSHRYDIGVWWNIGQDSALTGDECTVTRFLAHEIGTDLTDLELEGEEDTCGDLHGKLTATADVCKLAIVCADPSSGDTGIVKVPSCTTYKQPGGNEICDKVESTYKGLNNFSFAVLPGNPAKCECELTDFPILRCKLHEPTCLIEDIEKKCIPPAKETVIENVFGNISEFPCGPLEMTVEDEGDKCSKAITRTYTLTDGTDSYSCTQEISIIDNPPTLIGVPEDKSFECNPEKHYPVTASDDCGLKDLVLEKEEELTSELKGCENKIITRTWTATDTCGQEVTDFQTITVEDEDPPTFEITGGGSFNICYQDAATPLPFYSYSGLKDNCDADPEITKSCCLDGDTGVVTTTFTATDSCGNTLEKSGTYTMTGQDEDCS